MLSLWTQLRHLSHIDRKEEAKSSVGKAAAGGIQGVSTAWAVNASSVTYFSLPTLRNLAGMPPSVNHLDEPGCADGLYRWLPGLGTFGAQKAGFESLMDCPEATIVRIPNKAAIGENLLFGPA